MSITLDGCKLRGDKRQILKPVPSDVSVEALTMRLQKRLAELAQSGFVHLSQE